MNNPKTNITRLLLGLAICTSACTYETVQSNLCEVLPVIDALTILGTECGKATGTIEVISASETPVTYSIDGINFQQSNVFANLSAQSYTVSVKNELGCLTSQAVTIENLNGINILITSSPSGCDTNNGTINVTASGGPEPYTYKINGGSSQNASLFSGLASGTYTVLAVDADGCSVQQTTRVNTGQSFASIKSIINANCATSSCHGGRVSPDLRNNQNIQSNATRIATLTANGSMPPLGELSNNQIKEIACWVSDGAPIN
jgi:hypothetical protein